MEEGLYDDETGERVQVPVAPTASGAASNVLHGAMQVLPPIVGAVGTEAALSAAGVPELGIAPMLMRGAAAGLTNLGISKSLPRSLGGQPDSSALSDFAWGALPEIGSVGARTGINSLTERRLAHASEALMKEGATNILDPENLRVQGELLAPSRSIPFPETLMGGPARTAQADLARAPIQNTIQAMRTKYGNEIGQAYDLVKEVKEPVPTAGMNDFVSRVRQQSISPAPVGEKYLTQLRNMDPEVQRARWEEQQSMLPQVPAAPQAATPDMNATAQGLGFKSYAEMVSTPQGAALAQRMGLAPPAAGEAAPPAEFHERKVSFDELRQMRQQVNQDLQRAQGGDRFVLGSIQNHLDEMLMPYLPGNMGQLRSTYRGMIHRWDYARTNRLAGMADPNEIVTEAFKNPRDGYELIREARTPAEQDKLREGFVQYVWGNQPAGGTAKERAATIRQRLAPYTKDPAAMKVILGPQAGKHMTEMVAWAEHAPNLQQQLEKNPRARELFDQQFRRFFLQRGMDPDEATTRALQRMMMFAPGGSDIAGSTPMLPRMGAPPQGFRNVLAGRHGAMMGLSLALGRPDAAMYQGAMALSWLAHGSGYTAASKMGIARYFLNAFRPGGAAKAGYWIARGLDAAAHSGAQLFRGPAEPVEQP